MKHVRLRLRPDSETIHPLFSMMTDAEVISHAQMIDWNIGDTDQPTLVFAIEGDRDQVRSRLEVIDEISDYEMTSITSSRFYLHVHPLPTPLTRQLFELYESKDLIIVHPVVYENGAAQVSLLGTPEELQEAVSRFSSGLETTVDQISDFLPQSETAISRLPARQKQAIEIAYELGYYDFPRRTTHREIADRMNCAANTVSVHLQKAEGKIVSNVLT